MKGHPPWGRQGERHLPHPLVPPDQNKELRLPLTELQSWGQGGDCGQCSVSGEKKLFSFSALNPGHHPLGREPFSVLGEPVTFPLPLSRNASWQGCDHPV